MDKRQFVEKVDGLPYDTTYSDSLRIILEAKEDSLEAMADAFAYGFHIGSGKDGFDE